MKRSEKIKLLQQLEAGEVSISAFIPKTATVLYQNDNFYFQGSALVMTKEETYKKLKIFETVLFLPDNGRDSQ